MLIVGSGGDPGSGVLRLLPDGTVARLGDMREMSELLRLSVRQIRSLFDGATDGRQPDVTTRGPVVDGRMEVWAAGVTYQRSRAARVEESQNATIYDRVYDGERPELFFKSVAWRVIPDGDDIGVRADSSVNVPEPELAIVANAFGEIVGYTVCNDVSSRSIEGENALYLPQAKVYDRSCAVGSGVRPAWLVPDPYDLTIDVVVTRGDAVVWQATSSTALLHRRLPELVDYAFRCQSFPDGMVLSTGTPLAPEMSFDLSAGDVVEITIGDVGTLRNPVVRVGGVPG